MYKIWLLKLVPNIPYGRFLSSATIFFTLYFIFRYSISENSQTASANLFFSVIVAYIIPVFSFITEKTKHALDELRSVIALKDDQFLSLRKSLDHRTLNWSLTSLIVGVLCALGHLGYLYGSLIGILDSIGRSIGTVLVWSVMTTVIGALIHNAMIFGNLGAKNINIELFQIQKLVPFAKIAVISTLALIGALAIFPLLFLDRETTLVAILPPTLATLSPMLLLLALPIWPLHKRILAAKLDELKLIDEEIKKRFPHRQSPMSNVKELKQLVTLLSYRREISMITSWPFDIGVLTRLALYLIIPPFTWVGAALIEKLLDLYV